MLNTGQEQAVSCNARKILCLAGAGTGKTHSMISRISRLVNEQALIHLKFWYLLLQMRLLMK